MKNSLEYLTGGALRTARPTLRLLLVAVCGALGVARSTSAAEQIWSGQGSDDLWSTPANWDGTAPVAGDFLVFTNTVRLINTNNFAAGTLFGGITFATPSGAFNLWGN